MTRRTLFLLAGGLVALSACAEGPAASTAVTQSRAQTAAGTPSTPTTARTADMRSTPASNKGAAATALPKMTVHKSPSCGCCGKWVEHMREAGFTVEVRNVDNLEPVKTRLGVPLGKGSCHTAEVGTLMVEGHVPAEDIKRLLAANDGSRGLVLPGMPAGSPGMEMPDGRVQRYTVEQVNADGSTTPFAVHGEQ